MDFFSFAAKDGSSRIRQVLKFNGALLVVAIVIVVAGALHRHASFADTVVGIALATAFMILLTGVALIAPVVRLLSERSKE